MKDAELIVALGRAKAQLKAKPQIESTKILIQRAETLESCYAQVQEFAKSHRRFATEIIEMANRKVESL